MKLGWGGKKDGKEEAQQYIERDKDDDDDEEENEENEEKMMMLLRLEHVVIKRRWILIYNLSEFLTQIDRVQSLKNFNLFWSSNTLN